MVNIAQVFCASFKRSAIFKRIRDIFTRVSERVPLILFGSTPLTLGACCRAGVTEICEVGVSRWGSFGGDGTDGVLLGAAPLVSADFFAGSSFFSTFAVPSNQNSKILPTIISNQPEAGLLLPPPPLVLTFATCAPDVTLSPSATSKASMTPAEGELTLKFVLSVSISAIVSSALT